MTVSVADVLDFLVSKSRAPSNFGAQLDRLRFGIQSDPDPFRARNDVEDHLLTQACLIRCVDDFSSRHEFSISTRQRKAADSGYKVLSKLQEKALTKRTPQGTIALGILRAYHERCLQNQDRGLVAIYGYLNAIAPEVMPTCPGEGELVDLFRRPAGKKVRATACEAYADSLLALRNHVRVWNKKNKE